MKMQNVTKTMPLLMNFTMATPIEEEVELHNIVYDELSQTVYDMRTVGTKCLKSHTTKKAGTSRVTTDRKNEIDDTKSVK